MGKNIILFLVLLFFVSAAVFSVFFVQGNWAARLGLIKTSTQPLSSSGGENTDATASARIGEPLNLPLTIPDGTSIGIFAKNLGTPRDIQFSPAGTMLVSIQKGGKVVALPDQNQDGTADRTVEVLTGLNTPHGLAFYHDKLFVAEQTKVVRYHWDENDLVATFDKELFALPRGGNHVTRTIVFDNSGNLYVSIGSTCNVCEEADGRYAAVLVSNENGDNPQVFAKGLRNSVFLTIHPTTGDLWATDMGRDYLGDFTPPDEVNILRSNRDYGWPICWGNKVHDTLFDKKLYISDPCAKTESPQYGLAAHSAPLGLTFISSAQFPAGDQNDLLVALHGSWNRTSPIGYKIIKLDMNGNDVIGEEDFISGFLTREASVIGRPVDVAFDVMGSLFISDDKNGMVYKVIKN